MAAFVLSRFVTAGCLYFSAENFRRRDAMQQGAVNFQYDDVSRYLYTRVCVLPGGFVNNL